MTENPINDWAGQEIMLVPVPKHLYSAVVKVLGGVASASPAPPPAAPKVVKGWTLPLLTRLLRDFRVHATAKTLVTLLAKRRGGSVYFSELATDLQLPMPVMRGQLSAFTKALSRPEFATLGPLFTIHLSRADGKNDTEYFGTLDGVLWSDLWDALLDADLTT